MSGPAKWDWNSSSANSAAYAALTSHGRTADFTVAVWNNILTKISEQRVSWTDTPWDVHGASLQNTQMVSGGSMTAMRFNSAVKNMPPIRSWPWQADLGRTDMHKGDMCKGAYFIYLTDGLNHWIDLVPIPFSFENAGTSSIVINGVALPAVHVVGEHVFEWDADTTVRVDQSAPVKIDWQTESAHAGVLSVLNNLNVRIVNFAHVNIRDKTSLYRAAHVIGELNAAIQQSGRVSYNARELIKAALQFNYSSAGRLSTRTSDQMQAHLNLGSANFDASFDFAYTHELACDMAFHAQGEPLITERESEPLKASLNMSSTLISQLSSTARIPLPLSASLVAQMTGSATLGSLLTIDTGADVSGTFTASGTITGKTAAHVKSGIQSTSELAATAAILAGTTSAEGSITSESSFSANAVIKNADGFTASMTTEYIASACIRLVGYTPAFVAMLFQHSGSAGLTLSTTSTVTTALAFQYNNTGAVSCISSTNTECNLSVINEIGCSISFLTVTLVSDIDDALVSELDDILVSDVECS